MRKNKRFREYRNWDRNVDMGLSPTYPVRRGCCAVMFSWPTRPYHRNHSIVTSTFWTLDFNLG